MVTRRGRGWAVGSKGCAMSSALEPAPRRPVRPATIFANPAAGRGPGWLLAALDAQTPLAPVAAWGLLTLLDGGVPESWGPRLRAQVEHELPVLLEVDPAVWARLLAARSQTHPVQADPDLLADQVGAGMAVLSGLVVARLAGIGIGPKGVSEAEVGGWATQVYVRDRLTISRIEVVDRAACDGPEELPEPLVEPIPVIVRMPAGGWPFPGGLEFAPSAVVAIDLLDSGVPAAVRAGANQLRQLVRWHLEAMKVTESKRR